MILKSHEAIAYYRQICAIQQKGAKNLAEVESRKEKQAAGATETASDIKGKIIDYIWSLKKQGYAESTVLGYGYTIKWLVKKGADLFNPESVKEILAKESCSNGRKANIVKAYTLWLEMHGLTWVPPQYQLASKLPFIPLEKELDDLIASCSRQMAAFLQLLKETAMRCGEALKLKWTDIDFATNTVRISPEKGSNPRICKISNTLAAMLGSLPKENQNVFTYKNTFYLRKTFAKQRKKAAHKLGNPRILQIHFHTFRHWKATMLYHQTKDILYVKNFLGHRNINNTLIYVQLAETIFKELEEYICKTAKTLEEAAKLIEAGFEYVTDIDGVKLFRKHK
ncbi:site-specific integrase [Candidatus Bathyarchaeota archaeon]|nr:site-specific integrase [Candidatus Bathyarchaeota archaeon]